MKMTNRKIKLLFIHDNLEGGGGERILVDLLNNIDRTKFDLSLVLKEKRGVFLNKVRKDVKVCSLMKINALKDERFLMRAFRYIQQVYTLCKIINSEKPDIIMGISALIYPTIIFKKLFARKTKVILNIQIHLTMGLLEESPDIKDKFFLEKMLPKFLYRMCQMADGVICASKGLDYDINKRFGVPKNKIIVIYNFINIEEINKLKNEEIYDDWFKNNNSKIIAVGRLHPQKGFTYLLKAFKIVRENRINADLTILGEGREEVNLKNLTRDLGLDNQVVFAGFQENPYKYMKNSDIFVLSSIFEGFGNVLIEAMACGIPVISTRCPSGPDEIITNNVNGVLVPVRDEKALADAMINLLKDRNKAERMTKEGIKRANDFDIEKMVKEYEKTFIKCYCE